MRDEIKKDLILKAAIIIIIVSIFAIAMRYSWDIYSECNDLLNTILENEKIK
tara:strand:- start:5919 stop:6074 length:156 start_codon:yes stop_codon:yes gene_type:complete